MTCPHCRRRHRARVIVATLYRPPTLTAPVADYWLAA